MVYPVLYTIAMQGYYLALRLAAPFNRKAKQFIEGRKHIPFDLDKIKAKNKPVVWLHCASVGEFEQALPIIEAIHNDFPAYQCLVSFFSPSGYQFAQKRYPQLLITYLPYDSPAQCDYFIRKIRPHIAIFIKYELWYHILNTCASARVPLFLVDGIFRKNQLFFSRLAPLFKPLFRPFKHFMLQNEESGHLLSRIGFSNYTIMGDTRYDRVMSTSRQAFNEPIMNRFCSTLGTAFVAGSVWDSDIPVLKEIIRTLPKNMPIILAPHQIGHFNTAWLNEPFIQYTQFEHFNGERILILDTLGLLSASYRFGLFAYVGGGFGKGIHNILEAGVYGNPVLIGPKFQKFLEAETMVKQQMAFPISPENAASKTQYLLENAHTLRPKLTAYFDGSSNATDKIMVFLKKAEFLKSNPVFKTNF